MRVRVPKPWLKVLYEAVKKARATPGLAEPQTPIAAQSGLGRQTQRTLSRQGAAVQC